MLHLPCTAAYLFGVVLAQVYDGGKFPISAAELELVQSDGRERSLFCFAVHVPVTARPHYHFVNLPSGYFGSVVSGE